MSVSTVLVNKRVHIKILIVAMTTFKEYIIDSRKQKVDRVSTVV